MGISAPPCRLSPISFPKPTGLFFPRLPLTLLNIFSTAGKRQIHHNTLILLPQSRGIHSPSCKGVKKEVFFFICEDWAAYTPPT